MLGAQFCFTSRSWPRPPGQCSLELERLPLKVLVTGGAGFIGSHTTKVLLERGYNVRLLDVLKPPVHPSSAPPAWLSREAELMIGDTRDRETMRRSLRGV